MNYGATWTPRISEQQKGNFELERRAYTYQALPESDPCAFVEPKMVPRCPPGMTCAMGGETPSQAYLQCLSANPKDKKAAFMDRFTDSLKKKSPVWWMVLGGATALFLVRYGRRK